MIAAHRFCQSHSSRDLHSLRYTNSLQVSCVSSSTCSSDPLNIFLRPTIQVRWLGIFVVASRREALVYIITGLICIFSFRRFFVTRARKRTSRTFYLSLSPEFCHFDSVFITFPLFVLKPSQQIYNIIKNT